MITAEQVREEIDKVESLILTARRLLSTGALVDLRAIEERVRAICGAVRDMPREDGQGLVAELLSTIEKLDRLGGDLNEQLDQLQARLGGEPSPPGGG